MLVLVKWYTRYLKISKQG